MIRVSLETLSGGIINFYMNSEYDKNIHPEYLNILKFDGTKDALTKSINLNFRTRKRFSYRNYPIFTGKS